MTVFYETILTTAGVTAEDETDFFPDLTTGVGALAREGDGPSRPLLGSGVDRAVSLLRPGPHHVLSQVGLRPVLLVAGAHLVHCNI